MKRCPDCPTGPRDGCERCGGSGWVDVPACAESASVRPVTIGTGAKPGGEAGEAGVGVGEGAATKGGSRFNLFLIPTVAASAAFAFSDMIGGWHGRPPNFVLLVLISLPTAWVYRRISQYDRRLPFGLFGLPLVLSASCSGGVFVLWIAQLLDTLARGALLGTPPAVYTIGTFLTALVAFVTGALTALCIRLAGTGASDGSSAPVPAVLIGLPVLWFFWDGLVGATYWKVIVDKRSTPFFWNVPDAFVEARDRLPAIRLALYQYGGYMTLEAFYWQVLLPSASVVALLGLTLRRRSD